MIKPIRSLSLQTTVLTLALGAVVLLATAAACTSKSESAAERGKYLVNAFGCTDCHTPFQLGPNGPEPDQSRLLSGHPETLAMPPAPKLPPGPWLTTVAATNTAWAGPWGVSFTANLTPDPETGLGKWSEQDFVTTIRSARHLGRGRAILPPMPVAALANLSEPDLRAIFAFLQTLPPIRNQVPQPVPPAQ